MKPTAANFTWLEFINRQTVPVLRKWDSVVNGIPWVTTPTQRWLTVDWLEVNSQKALSKSLVLLTLAGVPSQSPITIYYHVCILQLLSILFHNRWNGLQGFQRANFSFWASYFRKKLLLRMLNFTRCCFRKLHCGKQRQSSLMCVCVCVCIRLRSATTWAARQSLTSGIDRPTKQTYESSPGSCQYTCRAWNQNRQWWRAACTRLEPILHLIHNNILQN